MSKLYFPSKIKVGYQNRSDTYTKKLAYVTYYDHKDVLRKEKSWEGWRDKKIEPDDFENVPTSGFVINRNGGGGSRRSWDDRKAFVRIFDPRGFEFEIGIDNLMFILEVYDVMKGKGIIGEFVYAWEGTALVLLPVDSENYSEAIENTSLKSSELDMKDVVIGKSYEFKEGQKMVYLGNEFVHENDYWGWESSYHKPFGINERFFSEEKYVKSKDYLNHLGMNVVKSHIFYDIDKDEFMTTKNRKLISRVLDDNIYSDLSGLFEKFNRDYHSTGFVNIHTNPDIDYFKYLYNASRRQTVQSSEYEKLGREVSVNVDIHMYLYEKAGENMYYLCEPKITKAWLIEETNSQYYWSRSFIKMREVNEIKLKRIKLIKFDGSEVKYLTVPPKERLVREFNEETFLDLFKNEEKYSFLDMEKSNGKKIIIKRLY